MATISLSAESRRLLGLLLTRAGGGWVLEANELQFALLAFLGTWDVTGHFGVGDGEVMVADKFTSPDWALASYDQWAAHDCGPSVLLVDVVSRGWWSIAENAIVI